METNQPNSTIAEALLRRIQNEVVPRIVNATVFVVRLLNDCIKLDRTGVLLRIAHDYFILTASHKLRERVQPDVPLFVGLREGDPPEVSLVDSWFHTTETDARDVAVIKLSASAAAQICREKQPISLRDIQISAEQSPGFFLMLGFPQEWFEVYREFLDAKPLPFFTKFYDGIAKVIDGMAFNPEWHGLFTLENNAIRAGDWLNVLLPDFTGMKGVSGCGVWRICDAEPSAMHSWCPQDYRLVAIQHRYNQTNGYIHATWAKFAVQRIYDEYPNLRPAFNIEYPAR